jgi:hypothetical protein
MRITVRTEPETVLHPDHRFEAILASGAPKTSCSKAHARSLSI